MGKEKYKAYENYKYSFFVGDAKQLILRYLCHNDFSYSNLKEICDCTGLSPSTASINVSELIEKNILERVSEGKYVFVRMREDLVIDFQMIFEQLNNVCSMLKQEKDVHIPV